MNGLQNFLAARLPCVVTICDVKGAKAFGMYNLKGRVPAVLADAFWFSEKKACEALEALGYKRMADDGKNLAGPHFWPENP